MNIKSFLTIVSLCLTGLLHAQTNQDYIVTMKGDTIYGKITSVKDTKLKIKTANAKQSLKSAEVFKAVDNKNKKLYMPSRVAIKKGLTKVAGTELDLYQLSKTKATKRPQLVEVLTDGEIAIYSFEKTQTYGSAGGFGAGGYGGGMVGTTSKTYYYAVKKSTGEIIKIKKAGFLFESGKLKKKTMDDIAKLIEDEPEWQQILEKEDKLTFDHFVDYIIGYNELRTAKGYDAGQYNFQIF